MPRTEDDWWTHLRSQDLVTFRQDLGRALVDEFNTASGGVVNVKDRPFNAKGDGVTDDTAAIQAAIDAAEAAGAGVVYLTQETYSISNITVDAAKVRLVGAGRRATILKAASGATGTMVTFEGVTLPGAHIEHNGLENIGIDGNDEDVIGLELKFCSLFTLDRVEILNCTQGNGLFVTETFDSWIYDLRINTCGSVANTAAALRIYNGDSDNSNVLRFFGLHLESNLYADLFLDSSGSGDGSNNNINFYSAKIEEGSGTGTLAVLVNGGEYINFLNGNVFGYGDGVGFDLTAGIVNITGTTLANTSTGGTGIDVGATATVRLFNNAFNSWTTDIDLNGADRERVTISGNYDSVGTGRPITIADFNNTSWSVSPNDNMAWRTTLTDDTAVRLTHMISDGFFDYIEFSSTSLNRTGAFRASDYSTPTAPVSVYGGVGNVLFTTGALTGTAGTDNNLNISTHTDGSIYFENRLGFNYNLLVRPRGFVNSGA